MTETYNGKIYLYEDDSGQMLKAMGYSERACKTCVNFNIDEGEEDDNGMGLCEKNCIALEVNIDGTGHCDHHHQKKELKKVI